MSHSAQNITGMGIRCSSVPQASMEHNYWVTTTIYGGTGLWCAQILSITGPFFSVQGIPKCFVTTSSNYAHFNCQTQVLFKPRGIINNLNKLPPLFQQHTFQLVAYLPSAFIYIKSRCCYLFSKCILNVK